VDLGVVLVVRRVGPGVLGPVVHRRYAILTVVVQPQAVQATSALTSGSGGQNPDRCTAPDAEEGADDFPVGGRSDDV